MPQHYEKILFVDDEAAIVAGMVRQFRNQFDLTPAGGGQEALELLRSAGPFAVVVSDYKMPVMDGIQFLAKVRELSADTVRVMLTGHADLDTAMQAVNEGNIFRFLTKPCPPDVFSNTLVAAIEQYRLIIAERDLLQRTLGGSVRVLTDILALASPLAFGRATRVREHARRLAVHSGMQDVWHVELAAMLSHIGYVTMLPETVEKIYTGKPLSPAETQAFEKHPQVGHDLIARVPRLEKVARVVAYQEKKYNGLGMPRDDISGDEIPIGARILKLVIDFDVLESSGQERTAIIEQLRMRLNWYDPKLLAAFIELLALEAKDEIQALLITDLEAGMITVDAVRTESGVLLLAARQEISEVLLVRLKQFSQIARINEPVRVIVPGHMTAPEETVSPMV